VFGQACGVVVGERVLRERRAWRPHIGHLAIAEDGGHRHLVRQGNHIVEFVPRRRAPTGVAHVGLDAKAEARRVRQFIVAAGRHLAYTVHVHVVLAVLSMDSNPKCRARRPPNARASARELCYRPCHPFIEIDRIGDIRQIEIVVCVLVAKKQIPLRYRGVRHGHRPLKHAIAVRQSRIVDRPQRIAHVADGVRLPAGDAPRPSLRRPVVAQRRDAIGPPKPVSECSYAISRRPVGHVHHAQILQARAIRIASCRAVDLAVHRIVGKQRRRRLGDVKPEQAGQRVGRDIKPVPAYLERVAAKRG